MHFRAVSCSARALTCPCTSPLSQLLGQRFATGRNSITTLGLILSIFFFLSPSQTLKDTDDYECLRFLRARKFKIPDAMELFKGYKEWYTKNNIKNLLTRAPPKADLLRKMVRSVP